MIFILIIIIAVKENERKLKNTLKVVKLDDHLTKKNSLTNQLEVIVFKRHEVGTL